MTTPDPAIVAAYSRAFARSSVQVAIKRITGFAPNPTASETAIVRAIVRDYQPDTMQVAQMGLAATKIGAITEGDRLVIVLACDLAAQRFPLPLKKNDRVLLIATGDELNVVSIDANKRAAAGAIELKAAGVQ